MIARFKKAVKNYFRPEKADHSEFLPGGLAVRETPPHPAPRIFLYVLMTLIASILLWAILGKTEVVAVSQGVIIPSDKSSTIQVFDRAVVKKIYVRDGDIVTSGQTLLELDSGLAEADLERIESELAYNRAQELRVEALLDALKEKRDPVLNVPDDVAISDETLQKARQRLKSDYDNLQSRLKENRSRIDIANQEIRSFRNAYAQRQKLLNIKIQRQKNYKTLSDQDFLPKNRYLEIREEVISLQSELSGLRDRISEKKATISGLRSEASVLIQQAQTPATEEAQEARRNIASLLEQKKKAEITLKTTRLIAPIDGMVQQLAVNTVGGVVTPAQPVMVIVPNDATLEAEVTFQNKDIGFIEVGQETHVKIDSFPYTKYGMVDGEVTVISGDAIEDEKQGLVYKGRVKLFKNTIRVGNKDVPLQPGMRLTAEVKTDERRLIEYFLSPIMVHTDQAFRER